MPSLDQLHRLEALEAVLSPYVRRIVFDEYPDISRILADLEAKGRLDPAPGSGVMCIPAPISLEEWEESVRDQQRTLIETEWPK